MATAVRSMGGRGPGGQTVALLDLRPARDADKTGIFGAFRLPVCQLSAGLSPVATPAPGFGAALAARGEGQKGALLLLLCPTQPGRGAEQAAAALAALPPGCDWAAEVEGGAEAWARAFTPAGKRRQKGAWGAGTEMSFWTASNVRAPLVSRAATHAPATSPRVAVIHPGRRMGPRALGLHLPPRPTVGPQRRQPPAAAAGSRVSTLRQG